MSRIKEVTGEAAACDNPKCPTAAFDRDMLKLHIKLERRMFQVTHSDCAAFTVCEACLEELGYDLPDEVGA